MKIAVNREILDNLKSSLEVDKSTIAKGIESNKIREELLEKQSVFDEKYNSLLCYKQKLDTSIKICRKFTDEFKLCRRDDVERRVEDILAKLYPDEDFGVYFDIENKYNKLQAELKIGPKSEPIERWSSPSTSNGGFVKQLTSASIIASICDMRGVSLLMFDEQFCSSDNRNSEKIPEVIFNSDYVKNKQIILIEHKPEVYAQLDKRIIRPYKDRALGYVVSAEIFDDK